jgi:histidine triad (HIT) family protein
MTEANFATDDLEVDGPCDFCGIVAGTEERSVRYEDDELMVFRNKLTWVPVMLLIVPKVHMSQKEFWRSPLFSRAADVAVTIAEQDAPTGYRFVSNFGRQAAQSQVHGHLHILGGGEMGLYMDFPRKGDHWLRWFGYTEWDPERDKRRKEAREQRLAIENQEEQA